MFYENPLSGSEEVENKIVDRRADDGLAPDTRDHNRALIEPSAYMN